MSDTNTSSVSSAKSAALEISPENPWIGLASFKEEHSAYFFGRDAEIAEIHSRLRENPLTILYGQSGLGKSSLLGAGLIPRLKTEARYRPVLLRLRYDEAAPTLLDQVRAALFPKNSELTDDIPEGSSIPPDATLWEIFHHREYSLNTGERQPVLIIDQFEEIFTLGKLNENRQIEAGLWLTQIADLVQNRPPLALAERLRANRRLARDFDFSAPTPPVILTLREDYLSHLEDWKTTLPLLMQNRMVVRLLNGPQALEAVVCPGNLGGHCLISEEVGASIVRFVAEKEPDVPLEEIEAVPPLLSLVCTELNRLRLERNLAVITADLVHTQSADILKSFYHESFAGLPDCVRHFIEDRLVTEGGHRNPFALEDALTALQRAGVEKPRTALNQLIARRLVSPEERGGLMWIEITHDVLTPLVVRSRDERIENERAAEAEQKERAAQKARRKLQSLLSLFSILTLLAVAGAFIGWVKTREANQATSEAKEQARIATEANDVAQKRFDSAVDSIFSSYQRYKENVFEGMPNIYLKDARKFLRPLRSQAISELELLHAAQPDHRKCLLALCSLYLDEIAQARVDWDWERISHCCVTMEQYWKRIPQPSIKEIEMYSDHTLWKALAVYYLKSPEEGVMSAGIERENLFLDLQKYPESWKLRYIDLRLECCQILDNATPEQLLMLHRKMSDLLGLSHGDFQVALWNFKFGNNVHMDNRWKSMPLSELEQLLALFRNTLLNEIKISSGRNISRLQTEDAAEEIVRLLNFTCYRLIGVTDDLEKEEKKRILKLFNILLSDLFIRLPRSEVVNRAYSAFYILERNCIATGTGYRSQNQLNFEIQRFKQSALYAGVPSEIQESIKTSLDTYLSVKSNLDDEKNSKRIAGTEPVDDIPGATPERGREAVDLLRFAAGAVSSLDLTDLESALSGLVRETADKLSGLPEDDPVLVPLSSIIDYYIDATANAAPTMRASRMDKFADGTLWYVKIMRTRGQDEQIREYWNRCFDGLDLTTTKGDRSSLLTLAKIAALAFMERGDWESAGKIHAQISTMAESILSERPWDWYLREAYVDLNFDLASALAQNNQNLDAQRLLRTAWTTTLKKHGEEIDLKKFKVLPLRGEVPDGANESEVKFFTLFKPKEEGGSGNKMFVIPCMVNGVKVPIQFYITPGKNGYPGLLDQFRWIKEYRGIDVPEDVQGSLKKLSDISIENKVNFLDLCTYALNYPTDEDKDSKSEKPKSDADKKEIPLDEINKLRPPTKEELEKYGDEEVVVLLMGTNKLGDKIYNYIKIKFRDYFRMRDAIKAGGDFDIKKFGEVVAAGKGDPSEEVRVEIEGKYKFLAFPE